MRGLPERLGIAFSPSAEAAAVVETSGAPLRSSDERAEVECPVGA